MIATINGSATYHLHDHLSVRVNTDSNGNVLGQQGHYPFGEPWYMNSTTTKWQFTGYERDAESGTTAAGSGNDYAMARYYVNRLGRFSSLDPLSGSIAYPQSLNKYAYVTNDPINATDPTGRDEFLTDCGDTHNGNGDEFCHPATGDCNGVDYCTDDGGDGGAGGGGGAGGDGGAGGGDPTSTCTDIIYTCPNRSNVSTDDLNDCTEYLYGVSADSFSQSGSDSGSGSFTGSLVFGEDAITINVAYNAVGNIGTYCDHGAGGCTPGDQFQSVNLNSSLGTGSASLGTFGLNNINSLQGAGSGTSTVVQLTELGNALSVFTGTLSVTQAQAQDATHNSGASTNNSPGLALYQCVYYGVDVYSLGP